MKKIDKITIFKKSDLIDKIEKKVEKIRKFKKFGKNQEVEKMPKIGKNTIEIRITNSDVTAK